ncbi:uncharacterized protein PAF06_007094 [Gastrophryne carolinensis]
MITWENVLPYPAYYFSPTETNTYQAVLITDGIYSFCFMTFQDGGMNWRYNSLPTYYSPKMGYFSGETSSYRPSPNFPSFNDQQTSSANIQRVYTPDQYRGTNTNRMGYWAYRLEYNNAMTVNAKQQCLTWYYNDLYAYPSWIYYSRPCPCSYWQAVFDSSYTQASNLRSIQQKNTDLFSPYYTFQSAFSSWYGGGTRCYYNYMGGLSYGEKERFLPTPWEYENSWYRLQYPSFYYYYYYPYYRSQLERISKEYKELEVDPYNNCCRYSGSSYYCSLYRQRRPYDYCFGYVPPRIGVLYGDPHITTLDGVQYTFNGLGEFTLANVRDENGTVIFMLQGRTNRAGNGTQATNFIGLAALIQNQTTVEWSLRDSNTTLVKINGTAFSLPDNATYVDKVTLEKTEKNEVLASFDGGISVTVSAKLGALSFVTMLDTSYKNKTEGLLGMFNDDKTDDLIAANGTKLQFDGTKLPNESLIFEIGMTWKTTPSNTIFTYNETEGESWYTYNNNSFVPLFYDELLQTSDPDLIKKANQTCSGNDECIFDILSTGNLAVGEATLGSVIAAQEQSSTMNNFPPNVTGPTTLMTKLYQPVTVSYTATDENNDTVILSLLSDSSDINLTADGVLVWLPTSSAPINATITADDSKVITEVALTLVLCNCTNNGSCLYDSPVSLINGTNNFMVAQCNCSAAWTGMYCEEDFNACAENKCYNTSTCVDRQAEEGFTCGPCPNNLEGDGITCRDIDECYSNTSNCQQMCSNYMGGYNCSCIEGYTINSVNIYQCDDIDECHNGAYPCAENANCTNLPGNYSCACLPGYEGDPNWLCIDIDECALNQTNCPSESICNNMNGSYECQCLKGYEGVNCTDINECENSTCPQNSICQNTIGSFDCQCKEGFGGENCTDIDECSLGTSNCNSWAVCNNTVGSYECKCRDGYSGNGTYCVDIDECLSNSFVCGAHANCSNTNGSYVCSCMVGFSFNENSTCVDIDECSSAEYCKGAGRMCHNTEGSYECLCQSGYTMKNETCEDINECETQNNCSAHAICSNVAGSYKCECMANYTGDGVNCTAIDECSLNTTQCDHICTSFLGGHICSCRDGYKVNDAISYKCDDINECLNTTSPCTGNANCTNLPGNFSCQCMPGYEGDGYKQCTDINECLNATSPCAVNANCTNLPGNFSCQCLPGYEGDGYKHCTALTSTSETPTTPYDNKTTGSLATMETISTPSVNESTFPTPFPLINASSVTPGDLNATTVSQMPKSTTESTNTTIQDIMTSNLTSSTNITTESPVPTVSATQTSVTSNATNATTAVTIPNESTTLVTDTSPVSEMNTTVIASGLNETTERTTHSTTLPVTNTTYAISSENATVNLSSTESTSFTTPIPETKTSVVTFGNTTTVSTNSSATLVSSGENATIVTTTSAPLPATDISAVTSTVNATTQSTINATVPVTSNTTGTSSLNATTQSTINATVPVTSNTTGTSSLNATTQSTINATVPVTSNTTGTSSLNATTQSTINATVPVTSTTSVPSSINATILSTINSTAIPVTSNTTGTSSLNATTQSSTNTLSETSTTSVTSNVNATTQSSMDATLSATSTSTNSVNTTILSPVNTTALPVTSNTTLTSSVNITILSTINTALPVATKTTVSSSANATTENQVSTTSATQTRNTTTVPATPTTIFISAMNTTAASNSTTAMPSTQSIVTALNASATFTTYVPTSGTAIKAVALFDYGGNAGDTAYTPRKTDFTSPVFSPLTGFPFGNQIRSFVYYTDNGQIVFPSSRNNRISYTNPPANGFSADYTVPSIAVFWNDADFSQNVGTTYYKEYTTNNDPVVKDVESMIRSNMNPSYSAAWTLKITWENAPAYPAKQNDNQTNTYQAVLTTDGFVSYVLMLYKDGGMNWDTAERYPKPLIGYCSGNRDAFFISDSKALNVYRPSNYVGANSALRGLWIYQLTSTSLDNSRMQCLNWYNNEPAPSSWNSNLLACPCLYNQGTSDSRYRVTKAGQTSTVRLLRSTFPNTQNAGVRCLYYRKNQFLEGNQERTWISPSSKVDSELNAYDLCCNKVDDPQFCALYMEKRPPISCRNYRPLSPGWMFGDPHITTLDGFGYTFNGLGDFTLLNASDSNINFILQGRTEQTGVAMATNFKAFALQYISNGTSTKVELYLESNNTINVLLNGQNVSFTYSEDSEAQISDNPTVFLLKNETITATFEGVLSVSVSAYYGMLSAVSSLPSQFINKTKGLLGTWNNDQNDDFLAPNGTYISSNSSEETLYNYGLLWEAKENSLFSQQEVKARAAFQPLFLDSLIKQDQSRYIALQTQCSNKTECIFDAMSTNDTNVGLATFQVVSDFQKTNSTLNAMPPVIEGVKLIQAFMSNTVTVQFSSNKTGVMFTADPGTNSDITVMGNGSLTWKPTNLSGFTFRLVATDSQNLSSTFQPSFVVCNCMLESQCSYNLTTSISNSSLAIAACVCTNNYTGEFCQDPPNLCSQGCFPAVSCNNITGCGPCPSGFVGDGLHCTGNGTYCEDDNECKKPSSCSLNAMCNNTIGSYQCSCNTGFTGNGTYCEDVDECKTSSPCSPNATCTNTIGSYQCKCITGYTGNGTHCEDLDECKLSYCSPNAMCTNTVGSYQCKCNTGFTVTGNGTSCCSDCDPNYCPNGGTCIMSLSSCTPTCLCPPQYSDGRCTILGTNYEPLIKPNTKERTVYVILSSAETITQDLGYNKIKGILSSATVNVASLFNNATSSIERINNTSTSNFTARFTYRANFTVIDYLNDQLVYFINKSPKSRTKRAAGITIEQATEGDKLTRAELANAFTCVPGYNFNSVSLQCISKCDSYCLNDGICNLVGDNAICKCQPFSIYATSGDRCENLTMNLNAFFGILFGALAFLLLVFVGIVLGVYFYRKRKRNIYDDTDRMYETRFSWKSSHFPSFEKFKSEKEIPQLTVDKKIPNLVSWRPHLEKVDSLTEVKIKRPEFKAEMNEYEQNLE